jgi:hypothetical protein
MLFSRLQLAFPDGIFNLSNKNISRLFLALTVSQCALLPVMAQSTALTGSIRQDYYPQRIISQDAVVAPVQAAIPSTAVRVAPRQGRVVEKHYYYERPVYHTVYMQDNRTFFERHPKVKAATVGAGVGAGVGAITGLVTHHGVFRGALIGAGTGAGVGLVRSSTVMSRHPIMRNVATGSLVGLGIGGAMGRHHGLQGLGIGAAVGLGASLLNGQFR